jgi:hypothetical protein
MRLVTKVPRGHWNTTRLLAALRGELLGTSTKTNAPTTSKTQDMPQTKRIMR